MPTYISAARQPWESISSTTRGTAIPPIAEADMSTARERLRSLENQLAVVATMTMKVPKDIPTVSRTIER